MEPTDGIIKLLKARTLYLHQRLLSANVMSLQGPCIQGYEQAIKAISKDLPN